jgi:pimeloyl-ACP methyl ester carboxylesterase
MSESDVTTRDGRVLRVSVEGDETGVPVLAIPGTPGSRRRPDREITRARERGVRLISYDRPGYGSSDRHEGRNVAACAGDVRAIANALGVRRLAVWGISGGGPHAAACAALLHDLVPAVGMLAAPAPYGAPGLNWLDGMGEDNITEFGAAITGADACRELLTAIRPEILSADPDAIVESMRSLLSAVDAGALSGETARDAAVSMETGLADGIDGWLDDDLAFVQDWGFGITQIQTPVLLMHGREDRFVPVAHGEWLAEAIPGVDARIYDDEGHISLRVNRLEELYDWLLARMS